MKSLAIRRPINFRLRTRARRNVLFSTALTLLALISIALLLAPWIAPHEPNAIDLSNIFGGPSATHPLGTDESGRDTLSRLLYGGRVALTAPLLVAAIVTLVGTALGLVAAWWKGPVEWIFLRCFDVLLSFPALLLAILGVAIFGPGLTAPMVAMVIAYTPYVALLARSLVTTEVSKPYVPAYRVQGFGGAYIALRRVLPNVAPTILSQAALTFGYVLVDLAALSFLGLGVQPPASDWGSMINGAPADLLANQPLPALFPAIAVVVVVMAVNVIGTEFADRLAGRTSA